SVLLLVDHSVREGASDSGRVISRRLQFVRTDGQGTLRFAGWAPHLDLEPLDAGELARVKPILEQSWLASGVEARALQHVAATLAPEHFEEVRARRERQIDRVHEAVQKRLVKEINHLSSRIIALEEEVRAGRQPRV